MSKHRKNKDELNDLEARFLSVYINNGFNATAAYLLVSPGVQYDTAKTEGNRFLTKPHVQHELELRKLAVKNKENIELGFLVQELKSIIFDIKTEIIERDDTGRITSKPDRSNAIKAIDTLAKLAGLYTSKTDITTNGESLNEITINIIPPRKEEEE